MDRNETIPPLGSPLYYMHDVIQESGTGILDSFNINPLPSGDASFQSITRSSLYLPTLSMNNPSSHGISIGTPPYRRKRGRPRKYGPQGAISLFRPTLISSTPTGKRRGRPPGSGPKQQLASLGGWQLNSAAMGFTPHVIAISAGEDILKKIALFCGQGPRSICILSANGAVSTAILHQPSLSGCTVTYEGRFEILCLSGSYMFTDNSYSGLSVSLASPDNRVIGGRIGGALIAATSIQVIVGSFLCAKTTRNVVESSEIAQSSQYQTYDNLANTANY